MASEENNYSPEFKLEVAQKALDQSKQDLDKLSKEYDVPVSVILMWTAELEKGGPEVFAPSEETETDTPEEELPDVDIDITDEEIAEGFDYGVMKDRLNYRRLIFWSILGIILVLVFVQALVEMNKYNERVAAEQVSAENEYYEVSQLKEDAEEQLNSFGVVNLEENIFRIPIDSAISNIAAETEN